MSHPEAAGAALSAMTSEPRISVENVVKTFDGKRALNGVSLQLRVGEYLGLLGPNGAGKSTLIRSIVGRVLPDSGSISVAGGVPGSDIARRALGFVPQELAVYPLLTPRENLQVFGRYQGLRGSDLNSAVDWALEWAALTDRNNDIAKTLSGGMKRRLNMAAGLLHRPQIILMDEPTVGVDPQSRERIYAMIEQLRSEGASLIYTSHYMEEVQRLCDRIAIIDHGAVIAEGSADSLIRQHFGAAHTATLHFESQLGEADLAWARHRGARVQDSALQFSITDPAADLPSLLQAVSQRGLRIRDMAVASPTLESLFLHLTGRDLRE